MLIYSKSEEKCPNTIIMFLFPVIWEFFHKSHMRVWTQRRSLHLSQIKLCSLKVKVWFQMQLCRQTERRSSCSLAATSSGSVLFATKCSFVSSVTAARPRGVEPAPLSQAAAAAEQSASSHRVVGLSPCPVCLHVCFSFLCFTTSPAFMRLVHIFYPNWADRFIYWKVKLN